MFECNGLMITFILISLSMGIIMGVAIYLGQKEFPFGVSLPKELSRHGTIQRLRKQFLGLVTGMSVLVTLPFSLLLSWVPFTEETLGRVFYVMIMGSLFVVAFYSYWLHGVYNKRLKVLKREEFGILPIKPQTVTASVSREEVPESDGLLGCGVLIIIMTLALTSSRYEQIPAEIEVWGGFTKRFSLFVIGPVFQFVLLGVSLAIKLQKSKALTLVILMILVMISAIQSIFVLGASFKGFFWIVIVANLLVGVCLIIRNQSKVANKKEKPMIIDEDDQWIWGLFYHNPNDPAFWVSARSLGYGFTLNFGHKKSKNLLVISFVFFILIMVWPLFVI